MPAIDVVARIVGMTATVDNQVAAVAIPGEAAPGLDDLRRRRRSTPVERLERRRRPDVAEEVAIDLQPAVRWHLQDQRQQLPGGDVGRNRLRERAGERRYRDQDHQATDQQRFPSRERGHDYSPKRLSRDAMHW